METAKDSMRDSLSQFKRHRVKENAEGGEGMSDVKG